MAGFRVKLPRTNTASGRALWQQAQAGMKEIINNLNSLIDWVEADVLPDVMKEAIKPTMDLSDHYAPKDTGTMVGSRYEEVKTNKGTGKVEIELGYNKHGEAPYTIFVHEMPQFYHQPPTQYKFLQRALDETTAEIAGRVAAGVRSRVRT